VDVLTDMESPNAAATRLGYAAADGPWEMALGGNPIWSVVYGFANPCPYGTESPSAT
jgi:hypothetical protein